VAARNGSASWGGLVNRGCVPAVRPIADDDNENREVLMTTPLRCIPLLVPPKTLGMHLLCVEYGVHIVAIASEYGTCTKIAHRRIKFSDACKTRITSACAPSGFTLSGHSCTHCADRRIGEKKIPTAHQTCSLRVRCYC
jgi:hypothetical protein